MSSTVLATDVAGSPLTSRGLRPIYACTRGGSDDACGQAWRGLFIVVMNHAG